MAEHEHRQSTTRGVGRNRIGRLTRGGLTFILLTGIGLTAGGVTPAGGAPTSSKGKCGTAWFTDSPPATHGGLYSLTAQAVTSNGELFDVGYDSPKGGVVQPFAETLNGTSWSVAPIQETADSNSELNAVSMSGPTSGWAVGWVASNGYLDYQSLADYWNGSAWSPVANPQVGAGSNLLLGVDAISSDDVWAVGLSEPNAASPRQTLAEQWNGTAWTVVATPDVGTGDNVLLSVNGDSPDDIWAVGYTETLNGIETLVEHYDGTSWTIVASPAGGPADNVLTSVSATSPNSAWAVGYQTTTTGEYHSLTEQWNGTTWTVVPVPSVGSSVDVLRGVFTGSNGDAWAVGTMLGSSMTDYQGFTLEWNGDAWNVLPLPSPTTQRQLTSVAQVPGTNQLWALGIQGKQTVAFDMCPGTTTEAVNASAIHPVPARRSDSPRSQHRARGSHAAPVHDLKSVADQPVTAVDEGASAGLPQSSNTVAAAVADFGNGLPDVFDAGEYADGGLYVNNGAGQFNEIDTSEFPPADRRWCDTADVDDDGSTDIFCSVGAENGNLMKTDDLFMEGSGMSFTNQAVADGVADPFARAGAVAFVPTPGGLPDLFVGADPTRSDGLPSPNRFYVNTGSGYQDAPQFGLDQSIGASCATAGDYTLDGYDDLLVCTQEGLKLYQNDEDDGFTDVTATSGLPDVIANDAIFTDLNGDGLPDIVIVTPKELIVMLQNPDNTFTESYSQPLTGGESVAAGDVTGSGVNDLYVVQGKSGSTLNEPDLLLLNNGSGTAFTPMTIPEATSGEGNAVYPIDFEQNGLTDFLVLNGGDISKPGPFQLISFFPLSTQLGLTASLQPDEGDRS